MSFLQGISLLLIYQLAGELSVSLLDIPVPGPVIGMVMLFLTLVIRGQSSKALDSSSTALLSHLSLLFVPAGVGIMVHFDRIINEWQAISTALILSTVITMAATALIMLGLNHLFAKKEQNDV